MAAADFFQQVHVLVQCSRVENQPMSIMEAMAWMRSTIATRAGGMPEMIADGVSGWLVPKGNARALAAAMREALAAPEMARRAGQIARRALARNYPFGPMIAEHQGLYDAAVQMFGGRRRRSRGDILNQTSRKFELSGAVKVDIGGKNGTSAHCFVAHLFN